jgi:hypothetical protein
MKAFLITAAIVFDLVVVAHIARLVFEPHVARDPWFLGTTLVALVLSGWAWLLVLRSRLFTPPKKPGPGDLS